MLHIGRHDVPKSANMYLWVKPPRLVTPEHIYEVPERLTTTALCSVWTKPPVSTPLRRLHEQRLPVIAISLLHATPIPPMSNASRHYVSTTVRRHQCRLVRGFYRSFGNMSAPWQPCSMPISATG